MYYYTCEPNLEAMLTCIYEAWSSKKGHRNIQLLTEPIAQITLFDDYIHVDADPEKADKVIHSIRKKLSPHFYRELVYLSMAYEEDALDTMYRCMILGFAYGPSVLNQVQYKDIMRYQEIRTRVSKEVNRFQEFLRFHKIHDNFYIAHFEPKSRIVLALGPIFEDRMPSEHWMIIDDVHREAIVHPKDQPFYLRTLTEAELNRLMETEKIHDQYTGLWKTFFDSVAIEQRINLNLQRNLFPLWTRKHVVEFD